MRSREQTREILDAARVLRRHGYVAVRRENAQARKLLLLTLAAGFRRASQKRRELEAYASWMDVLYDGKVDDLAHLKRERDRLREELEAGKPKWFARAVYCARVARDQDERADALAEALRAAEATIATLRAQLPYGDTDPEDVAAHARIEGWNAACREVAKRIDTLRETDWRTPHADVHNRAVAAARRVVEDTAVPERAEPAR